MHWIIFFNEIPFSWNNTVIIKNEWSDYEYYAIDYLRRSTIFFCLLYEWYFVYYACLTLHVWDLILVLQY